MVTIRGFVPGEYVVNLHYYESHSNNPVAAYVFGFAAIFFFNVPFPIIVLGAGVIGYAGGKLWLEKFDVIKQREAASQPPSTARVWPLT